MTSNNAGWTIYVFAHLFERTYVRMRKLPGNTLPMVLVLKNFHRLYT